MLVNLLITQLLLNCSYSKDAWFCLLRLVHWEDSLPPVLNVFNCGLMAADKETGA